MNVRSIGWARAIRGLRSGDQATLLTGLALVLFQSYRSSKQQRELIYRKTVPVGSSIVIRHTKRGAPKLKILPPED